MKHLLCARLPTAYGNRLGSPRTLMSAVIDSIHLMDTETQAQGHERLAKVMARWGFEPRSVLLCSSLS
jgi:hypothetical protein